MHLVAGCSSSCLFSARAMHAYIFGPFYTIYHLLLWSGPMSKGVDPIPPVALLWLSLQPFSDSDSSVESVSVLRGRSRYGSSLYGFIKADAPFKTLSYRSSSKKSSISEEQSEKNSLFFALSCLHSCVLTRLALWAGVLAMTSQQRWRRSWITPPIRSFAVVIYLRMKVSWHKRLIVWIVLFLFIIFRGLFLVSRALWVFSWGHWFDSE